MKEELNRKFDYNPSNKALPLQYKINHRKARVGDLAGSLPANEREYAKIKVLGKTKRMHQAVWAYFNGEQPSGSVIDHINGDKLDNRIENLRITDNHTNKRRGSNKKYKSNTSGMTGIVVCSATGKWKVSFRKNGKLYYFGVYEDIEEAKIICKIKKEELFPESIRP